MSENLTKVKDYLVEMDLHIIKEDEPEELVIVRDVERGIQNLIIDCEPPILVIEQLIVPDLHGSEDAYRKLLQMNRTLVHGAFVLDDSGKNLFFRDTLALENLDYNELEASISALSLALAENADELLHFAKA